MKFTQKLKGGEVNLNKTNLYKPLLFLKIFCFTFITIFIAFKIIELISVAILNNLPRPTNYFYITFFSFLYSLLSVKNFKKYATKVMYEDMINKEVVVQIEKIMKKMHWSMIKKNNAGMVFKSTVLVVSWKEYLQVTINENDLGLVGPKYFVERLIKKLTQ